MVGRRGFVCSGQPWLGVDGLGPPHTFVWKLAAKLVGLSHPPVRLAQAFAYGDPKVPWGRQQEGTSRNTPGLVKPQFVSYSVKVESKVSPESSRKSPPKGWEGAESHVAMFTDSMCSILSLISHNKSLLETSFSSNLLGEYFHGRLLSFFFIPVFEYLVIFK